MECASTYPDFYNKALEYHSSRAIRVVDNATYENELTQYGETGAFVISGNDIRLPKITMYLKSLSNTLDVGTALPAGLPNITGTISNRGGSFYGATGALSTHNTSNQYGHQDNTGTAGISFDASKSNSVYGSADTVQPASVQVAFYIQVYHAAIAASMVDISSLTNQISALSNRVTQLTQQIESIRSTNFGAPDHARRVTLTPDRNATEVSYTPNVNGYISGFFMRQNDGSSDIDLIVNGITYAHWSRPGSYYVNGHMSVLMPVCAGQTIVVRRSSGNWNSTLNWLYFIPCA